jgi:DNA-binding NtrC family response regulator
MTRDTILYISDPTTSSDSISAALEATGYEVVSTDSPTEGVALLYVMRSAAAVVLDNRAREQASFDVAQTLRAIDPDMLIVLLCNEQTDCLSSYVDACLGTGQPLEELTAAVRRLVATKSPQMLIA